MKKDRFFIFIVTVLALLLTGGNASAQTATSTVFATGLRAPTKIITSPKGNLLVAEAGNGPNTGRISILDLSGNRRTLMDGLPSMSFPVKS